MKGGWAVRIAPPQKSKNHCTSEETKVRGSPSVKRRMVLVILTKNGGAQIMEGPAQLSDLLTSANEPSNEPQVVAW